MSSHDFEVPLPSRGPYEVRSAVMGLYEARFPAALTVARSAWALSAAQLPNPVLYSRHEAIVLDTLPMLSLSVGRAQEWTRRDYDAAMGEQYEPAYACRLYGWMKLLERGASLDGRDDFATVMAGVLLATPSLNADVDEVRGTGKFVFDENTLDINYSDSQRVRGDRYVAGVSLGFTVRHAEHVRRVPMGYADEIEVTATVLSENPGLD